MCVFPTAALHPAFIPTMGATGQHGWGGRPHYPFYLPYFRAVKRQSPPPSDYLLVHGGLHLPPNHIPGSSWSVWETEAISRQRAGRSG